MPAAAHAGFSYHWGPDESLPSCLADGVCLLNLMGVSVITGTRLPHQPMTAHCLDLLCLLGQASKDNRSASTLSWLQQ
jgi:hypothetical protein